MRRIAILLFLVLALAACEDKGNDPVSPSTVAGWYYLNSVNGETPRAVYFDGIASRFSIEGATLRLVVDGTCSESARLQYPDMGGGTHETYQSCNYTLEGRRVRLTYLSGWQLEGPYHDDGVLTLTDGSGTVYSYQKFRDG